jgi:hypothetical protein
MKSPYTVKTIKIDQSLRYLSPRDHDRINDLLTEFPCEYTNFSTHLQVLKILKVSSKYIDLLDKIEYFVAKKAGFNLILKNMPDVALNSETRKPVKVGYQEVLETLSQFGKVEKFLMIRGHVYATFDNPAPFHKLVNNMEIGDNIVTTRIIC